MCLTLKSDKTRVKTAKSDIVVYKKLKRFYIAKLAFALPIIDGEEFSGVINENEYEGKISIQNNIIFFCTNNENLNGNSCTDKKGYYHSWELDSAVKSIKTSTHELTNEDLMDSKINTPYQSFVVKEGTIYNSPLIKIGNEINEGLHTFKEKPNSSIWAECIIPKGSRYYEGMFDDKVSYASDTLKYVKIYEE
jgi:hypothetical protein